MKTTAKLTLVSNITIDTKQYGESIESKTFQEYRDFITPLQKSIQSKIKNFETCMKIIWLIITLILIFLDISFYKEIEGYKGIIISILGWLLILGLGFIPIEYFKERIIRKSKFEEVKDFIKADLKHELIEIQANVYTTAIAKIFGIQSPSFNFSDKEYVSERDLLYNWGLHTFKDHIVTGEKECNWFQYVWSLEEQIPLESSQIFLSDIYLNKLNLLVFVLSGDGLTRTFDGFDKSYILQSSFEEKWS